MCNGSNYNAVLSQVEQLRVANNCLMMEVERCRQLELQLQQLAQRTEEMDAVIKNKNNEIRYRELKKMSFSLLSTTLMVWISSDVNI